MDTCWDVHSPALEYSEVVGEGESKRNDNEVGEKLDSTENQSSHPAESAIDLQHTQLVSRTVVKAQIKGEIIIKRRNKASWK